MRQRDIKYNPDDPYGAAMTTGEMSRDCLDHGFTRLIDFMGDDNSIVRSARVSHAANEKTGQDPEADFRLVDYLYRNHHTSVFEHTIFTFHVKMPLFVVQQFLRHRTWSFNQISARYTELPEEYYIPQPGDVGVQSNTNHQARHTHDLIDQEIEDHEIQIGDMMRESNARSFEMYRALLEAGTPRELARTVLPAATYTELFATVDLNNLLKFLNLRLDEHAQFEIRVYAEAMLSLIEPIVPAAVAAWRAHQC